MGLCRHARTRNIWAPSLTEGCSFLFRDRVTTLFRTFLLLPMQRWHLIIAVFMFGVWMRI